MGSNEITDRKPIWLSCKINIKSTSSSRIVRFRVNVFEARIEFFGSTSDFFMSVQ